MMGNNHFVLDREGYIWGVGYNGGGLGVGDSSAKTGFVKVSEEKFKKIEAYNYRTLALHEDGSIWGAGENGNGVFGITSTTSQLLVFTKIHQGPFKDIALNEYCTFALDLDGRVWGAGYTSSGALGETLKPAVVIKNFQRIEDITTRFKKIKAISSEAVFGITEEGKFVRWGAGISNVTEIGSAGNSSVPIPVSGLEENIVEAVVTPNFISVINAKGEVFSAGYGGTSYGSGLLSPSYGVFKKITLPEGVKAKKIVSIGGESSFMLSENNDLYEAGNGNYNFLGYNSAEYKKSTKEARKVKAIQINGYGVVVILKSGEMYVQSLKDQSYLGTESTAFVISEKYKINMEPILHKFKYIAKEVQYTMMAINTEGHIYGWGRNSNGNLGLGHKEMVLKPELLSTERFTKVELGIYFAIALHEDGSVWATGLNWNNAFSSLPASTNYIGFKKILDGPFISILAGNYCSFFLKENGDVLSIGDNGMKYPERGLTTTARTTYVQIAENTKIINGILEPSGTRELTLRIGLDKKIYARGYNHNSLITTNETNGAITVKEYALEGEGYVKAVGTRESIVALKEDGTLWYKGGGRYNIGVYPNSPSTVMKQLGVDTDWIDISISENHILAKKKNGKIYGGGYNYYSLGDTNKGINYEQGLQEVPELRNAEIFSAGSETTYAMNEKGEFVTSGSNNYGQAGNNTRIIRKKGFDYSNHLLFPVGVAGEYEPSERIYDTSQNFFVVLKGEIPYKLNGLLPSETTPTGTGIRYAVSADNITWKVFRNGAWSTITKEAMRASGMTLEEIKALTTENLQAYSFNNIYLQLVMFTSDPEQSPIFYGMSALVDVVAQKPSVSAASVNYVEGELTYPPVYYSIDNGATWKKGKVDELTEILEDNKGFQIRVELRDNDEIQAISYSYD